MQVESSEDESSSESVKEEANDINAIKIEWENKQQDDGKIDETLFNLPEDLKLEEEKLQFRQRKTRWGQRQIKRSKIQEDAIFNPLQALYSGNSLLPITQYGQA